MPNTKRNPSGGFWLAGDLTLDLFTEFQGPGNLRKNLRRAASASHDDGTVAQEPTQSRLLDGDAFDPWQEQFDGAAIHDAGLYDDPLVGDGHLGGIALEQTHENKDGSEREAEESCPNHDAARGRNTGGFSTRTRSYEKSDGDDEEDCRDQGVPQQHDPVQAGFVLDGLARDEMLFGVAQKCSLRRIQKSPSGRHAANEGMRIKLISCHPAQG